MFTISLCMIVRDEEGTLARCLATVRDLVEEIVIVDTGSTDRTREIAKSFGAALYDFAWIDDFSAARNFAFGKATQDYILWLDADDVLEEQDRNRFRLLKEQHDFDYDAVSMPYYLTLDAEGKPDEFLRRNRLVRRACRVQWHGAVHEYLAVAGKVLHSDIAVTHRKEKAYTDRNLQIYLKRRERKEEFSPRDTYYFANELKDHGRYAEAAEQYGLFLDGGKGWIEDQLAACYKQAECYAHLKQPYRQVQSLLRALAYGEPRAELCCRLGGYFAEKEDFRTAIYWYRQATLLEQRQDTMGMTEHSAWTWLPHLQLCYCYDRVGDLKKAYLHHEMARMYNPRHPSVVHNEAYFAGISQTQ
ncbi:glycosyltransferase family 2 protein [Brevibacillus sp. GCM10020057]|uniref:glycosyltransferase family 2 protein n=1 Tax=Brevibacillus sp. GCM10020057 TaxID=3317327 RepID=UPI003626987C